MSVFHLRSWTWLASHDDVYADVPAYDTLLRARHDCRGNGRRDRAVFYSRCFTAG